MNPWERQPASVVPSSRCPVCAKVETFASGATIVSRQSAVVEYRGPSPTGEDALLKSAEQVKAEEEWWARLRLEERLNTIGPDGSEHVYAYQALGLAPGAQRFGAYHDVQAGEARRQALSQALEDPERALDVFERYRRANADSGVEGYRATLWSGPEHGAIRAQEIYRAHGFAVSGPEEIVLSSSGAAAP